MSKKKTFPPKINQNRVANNDFDLQNDFHEDRLSFPVYGEKIKLCHFRPFLRLAVLKVQHFCQNQVSRARNLGGRIILYGESEKIGPEMICGPPRFQLMSSVGDQRPVGRDPKSFFRSFNLGRNFLRSRPKQAATNFRVAIELDCDRVKFLGRDRPERKFKFI